MFQIQLKQHVSGATIALVLTDKPDAYALTRAEKAGIKAVCIDRKQFDVIFHGRYVQ